MKARIRATGEIIKVKMHFPEFERPYFTMVDSDGVTRFTSEDLEPFEPNWQQVRIQAAMYAMQGQLANDESVKQMIETLGSVALPDKTKAYMNLVARSSVMLADALIAELQKKGGQHE